MLTLKLPMKQRPPKSPLVAVAAAHAPSEGAIIIQRLSRCVSGAAGCQGALKKGDLHETSGNLATRGADSSPSRDRSRRGARWSRVDARPSSWHDRALLRPRRGRPTWASGSARLGPGARRNSPSAASCSASRRPSSSKARRWPSIPSRTGSGAVETRALSARE
jgi:hypothetical protein